MKCSFVMNRVGVNMGTGHFQEYEEEYLETLYDFHEKFPGPVSYTHLTQPTKA